MLVRKSYNHHLAFWLAAKPGEVIQMMFQLPGPVRVELINELESNGGAERFDLESLTAYALEKQGEALAFWIWSDVRSYDEAARLLAAIVELGEPLNPLLACQLYTNATERPSVLDSEHMPRDGGGS